MGKKKKKQEAKSPEDDGRDILSSNTRSGKSYGSAVDDVKHELDLDGVKHKLDLKHGTSMYAMWLRTLSAKQAMWLNTRMAQYAQCEPERRRLVRVVPDEYVRQNDGRDSFNAH